MKTIDKVVQNPKVTEKKCIQKGAAVVFHEVTAIMAIEAGLGPQIRIVVRISIKSHMMIDLYMIL